MTINITFPRLKLFPRQDLSSLRCTLISAFDLDDMMSAFDLDDMLTLSRDFILEYLFFSLDFILSLEYYLPNCLY